MIKKFLNVFTTTHDHFLGREEGEEVLVVARRHPFILLYTFFPLLIALFVPVLIKLYFPAEVARFGLTLFYFLTSLWYQVLWIMASYTIMIFSLNTVTVTNRRIIESEQIGFFSRKVSELPLNRIQDILVRTAGLFQTIFKFGHIAIQNAAERREFVFRNIARPEEVKNIIVEASMNRRPGSQRPL